MGPPLWFPTLPPLLSTLLPLPSTTSPPLLLPSAPLPTLPPLLSTVLPSPLSTLDSTTVGPTETTETTTEASTASVRLRPSPRLRLILLCTPPESTLPLSPPPTPTELLPLP